MCIFTCLRSDPHICIYIERENIWIICLALVGSLSLYVSLFLPLSLSIYLDDDDDEHHYWGHLHWPQWQPFPDHEQHGPLRKNTFQQNVNPALSNPGILFHQSIQTLVIPGFHWSCPWILEDYKSFQEVSVIPKIFLDFLRTVHETQQVYSSG